MQHNPTALQRMRHKMFGSRDFYKMVLAIVIPIIVQNAISNFVNLLDNIMVGRIGTDQMTGVSIVNQLLFISTLCVFGGVSGAGIFSAQYHGAQNHNGVRNCFRYKLYLCLFLTLASVLVLVFWETPLIMLFLNEENAGARIASTLGYGQKYLKIMLWGILPFALTQAYGSTLRETGETALPMRAGIIAVFTNLCLNYILIYGKLGAPAMGVEGAALATVISRFVELAIVAVSTHLKPKRYPFIVGAYRSLRVPLSLVKQIFIKGSPLLVNEALWSVGVSMVARCYSMRGLDVVTALNISNTVANLFNVIFLTMGNATAIIVGQALGAGENERAVDHAWKLIFFSIFCSLGTALMLCIAAPFIPAIYNTEEHIRQLATNFLFITAMCMPLISFVNSCYFILRSGGKTIITFLFDCGYTWVICLPIAYALVTFTDFPILTVYLCVQLAEFIKCMMGYGLVRRGIWINNMVSA